MLRQQLYNGLKADIWSSGVVLFAMLEGQLPFEDDNHQELTRKIKSAEY
jgi:serine/threonine protein kinase